MRALVIVDVQRDFLPDGALAVADSGRLPAAIHDHALSGDYALVVATQDWHPSVTPHFDKWPAHCVAGSHGARLDPYVDAVAEAVFRKGTGTDDGYSGLENAALAEALAGLSHEEGGLTVDVCGLALDHCVRATALDGAREMLDVRVLLHLTRAVTPEDAEAVVDELRRAGVEVA